MASTTHTPGPWFYSTDPNDFAFEHVQNQRGAIVAKPMRMGGNGAMEANARLIAAAPELLEALHEGRRAIGDHFAPNDCYATGPLTGDPIRDLVQCPACSFIAMYDAAIAKATGGAA